MSKSAFFAYPSSEPILTTADEAVREVRGIHVTPWPHLNTFGYRLDKLIREKIDTSDFLLADVTIPNFNVYYEIGYCVGSGKPVVPTVDFTLKGSKENVDLTGLFATTGQIRYQNYKDLAAKIEKIDLNDWRPIAPKPRNYNQPLFFLGAFKRTNFIEYISSAISNSKVEQRQFDPTDTNFMSINDAFAEVSASTGLILPLIAPNIEGDVKHNLLASTLAGMAHGLGIEALLIQFNDVPAPVDFREFISTARGKLETTNEVEEYCQQTLVLNQRSKPPPRKRSPTLLEQVDLGKSAAEHEATRLDQYFVHTAQFTAASRAKGGIVVGRKGSGKTAIFYATLEKKQADKRNLVVPLMPVSHRLSELRQSLVDVKAAGFFDHSIEAFWQYIIYMEIIYSLREALLPKAKYNLTQLKLIESVEQRFKMGSEHVYGDFTSRLETAVELVIKTIQGTPNASTAKETITNVLFEHEISKLRDSVAQLADGYKTINLLFDNVDKGWPATRVEEHDIKTVQHLINVMNKVQRELARKDLEFEYLLFLRGDVYERLVENTADRGKFDPIKVDWSDAEQLSNLIHQRVIAAVPEGKEEEAWNAINPIMDDKRTAVDVMIGASLMRPRFLIDLAEKALSIAVNRGHPVITVADVKTALEKHSLYLVTDFGLEVRDVSGLSESIFYDFIGEGQRLTPAQVTEIVRKRAGELEPHQMLICSCGTASSVFRMHVAGQFSSTTATMITSD
ncbi:hypothetical protein FXB40_44795 [Bradyrhizobium rifense]|uniref:Uncharacterized protein n=1 Tax=Bradyrhizobium rifense TaxID=515499 RepID=A0A5D3K9Y8_9BRAD|nr:hypothetical protein [Bradyrhizobium rifense]TYL84521.1 hypothetical protein FXB40_44795 [Bradyrhizobium rifense]